MSSPLLIVPLEKAWSDSARASSIKARKAGGVDRQNSQDKDKVDSAFVSYKALKAKYDAHPDKAGYEKAMEGALDAAKSADAKGRKLEYAMDSRVAKEQAALRAPFRDALREAKAAERKAWDATKGGKDKTAAEAASSRVSEIHEEWVKAGQSAPSLGAAKLAASSRNSDFQNVLDKETAKVAAKFRDIHSLRTKMDHDRRVVDSGYPTT